MPNFQTKNLTLLNFPCEVDGVRFEWICSDKNESLIYTISENESFFIKQIKRKDDYLIKGDKLAKPSSVKILQNALKAYEKATDAKSIFSNINSRKNRIQKDENYLKNIDFFANEFENFYKNYKRVFLEIGFGSGRHLLYQAKNNPSDIFIGVEIHKPSIEQVVKLCGIEKISNIVMIDYDARVLMEFLPSNILTSIFIHFPVPWDKKPHRRVINDEFLLQATRALKQNGTLELRSDSEEFFRYSLDLFLKQKQADISIRKNQDLNVSSKYEDRWKKMQKDIFDLTLRVLHTFHDKMTPFSLHFDEEVKANNFSKETILQDNFFVHFQNNFQINKNDFIWKVAFGDAFCVQNCYIIVQNKKARYFPKNIYSTKQNQKAHAIIKERLFS